MKGIIHLALLTIAITLCAILFGAGLGRLVNHLNRPNNGIHGAGPNAVVQGEAVVIHWGSNDADADRALELWRSLR